MNCILGINRKFLLNVVESTVFFFYSLAFRAVLAGRLMAEPAFLFWFPIFWVSQTINNYQDETWISMKLFYFNSWRPNVSLFSNAHILYTTDTSQQNILNLWIKFWIRMLPTLLFSQLIQQIIQRRVFQNSSILISLTSLYHSAFINSYFFLQFEYRIFTNIFYKFIIVNNSSNSATSRPLIV